MGVGWRERCRGIYIVGEELKRMFLGRRLGSLSVSKGGWIGWWFRFFGFFLDVGILDGIG